MEANGGQRRPMEAHGGPSRPMEAKGGQRRGMEAKGRQRGQCRVCGAGAPRSSRGSLGCGAGRSRGEAAWGQCQGQAGGQAPGPTCTGAGFWGGSVQILLFFFIFYFFRVLALGVRCLCDPAGTEPGGGGGGGTAPKGQQTRPKAKHEPRGSCPTP